MSTLKRILYLTCPALAILVLDQWSKMWAVAQLKHHLPRFYLGGMFQFRYAENFGAWGNLGAQWPPLIRQTFLLALPAAVLLFFVVNILIGRDITPAKALAFSFIVAGGAGNLIDRLRFDYVVDFMFMGIGPLHTNIFNVADVSIMTGLGLALLISAREWLRDRADKRRLA